MEGDQTKKPSFVSVFWRAIFSVVWPLLCLLVFAIDQTQEFKCMFVVLVMAGYWVTEAIPLPITSLLPIVMFPLMGILDTGSTCLCYFKETNCLFLGGLMLAVAIEYSNLHNRIAMLTVLCVGCSPRRLHFGLTFMTMFISMWISNTAATAMMCPIIIAVLSELESQGIGGLYLKGVDDGEDGPVPSPEANCYFLGACYASSIGGIGTLVGTGSNLTYKGIYETRFPDSDGVTFTAWMVFNIPGMLLMTFLVWIWLQILYMGMFRPNSAAAQTVKHGTENKDVAKGIIKAKYDSLGKITWHEAWVGILFLAAVFLLFFRKPGFIRGWAECITKINIKDSTPVMGIVVIMFMIPQKLIFLKSCDKDPAARPTRSSEGLLTWNVLQVKIAWGLLLLLGGGFALAEGTIRSGLSVYLGNALRALSSLPKTALLICVSFIASLATELTSNVAIANILLPVVSEMSVTLKIHPMFLMLPTAVCCSFAFMLPVGTPPNAVIKAAAGIRTSEMVKAGLGANIITLIVIVVMFQTLGQVVYDTSEFPSWANKSNSKGFYEVIQFMPTL